jgi:hypothetical protein
MLTLKVISTEAKTMTIDGQSRSGVLLRAGLDDTDPTNRAGVIRFAVATFIESTDARASLQVGDTFTTDF